MRLISCPQRTCPCQCCPCAVTADCDAGFINLQHIGIVIHILQRSAAVVKRCRKWRNIGCAVMHKHNTAICLHGIAGADFVQIPGFFKKETAAMNIHQARQNTRRLFRFIYSHTQLFFCIIRNYQHPFSHSGWNFRFTHTPHGVIAHGNQRNTCGLFWHKKFINQPKSLCQRIFFIAIPGPSSCQR